MNKPRVLVSSIDVWNSVSGSDTFTNLLSGYDSDKVANIYFRSGTPSSTAAGQYFYLSENSVIKSIFMPELETGWRVKRDTEAEFNKQMEQNASIERKRYSFFLKHRLWLFIYAREVLWKLGKWKSAALDRFVDDFQPEVLFFPIESYIHFNRVNQYLIKKTNIPAVAYIWDDNFTYKSSKNIGFLVHRFFLRRSVRDLLNQVQKVFVINPKMQRELRECYGIDSEVLTKGAKIIQHCNIPEPSHPLKMVYTGKLIYGRLETIQTVAAVLDVVNCEEVKVLFDIYSTTPLSVNEKQSLAKKGVRFCGGVPQEKVVDIQNEADILLFAEALGGKHMYDARLSFSTKLVDYLAAGKCIVAIGPKDIAPIEYLKDNDGALCASTREEIQNMFENSISIDVVRQYGKKAQQLAETNHAIDAIQERLYKEYQNLFRMEQI